jgi:mannose-6-phosphate isomerase-like protein (cupin superfamily)
MTDYRLDRVPGKETHHESPSHAPMSIMDLPAIAAEVADPYLNFVVAKVNDHVLRMAVMQGEFRWHVHADSDECFIVTEGRLEIDFEHGGQVSLGPGQAFCIPAGVVHRTRAAERTVNLCIERASTYTDVTFVDR